MMLFVSISIIAIAIVIFIGYIIKSAIKQPIVLLEKDMERVSEGDLTIRTSYKSNNELGSIVKSFNSMLDNLQQLIGEVKTQHKKLFLLPMGCYKILNEHLIYQERLFKQYLRSIKNRRTSY